MANLTVGVAAPISVVSGVEQDFTIPVVTPGKYVLEVTGVETLVGLYNQGGVGQLIVCGSSSKGIHVVANVGNWTIKVFPRTTGSVTINLRPWNKYGLDYLWSILGWYRSTC